MSAVGEATHLAYGHLFNPTFAAEISSIDPLPHQRVAVYEHLLGRSPLRFLLADDAGAGKTIMTGLDLLRSALKCYPDDVRDRFTVSRPTDAV